MKVSEKLNNKWIHSKTLRGLNLLCNGITSDGKKCAFFSPVAVVDVNEDLSITESLVKDAGSFFSVRDGKVIPKISSGDSIQISFKGVHMWNGVTTYRIVRLKEVF